MKVKTIAKVVGTIFAVDFVVTTTYRYIGFIGKAMKDHGYENLGNGVMRIKKPIDDPRTVSQIIKNDLDSSVSEGWKWLLNKDSKEEKGS